MDLDSIHEPVELSKSDMGRLVTSAHELEVVLSHERTITTKKSCKRKDPFLVGRALEAIEEDHKVAGGFFDCNICYHEAVNPVVTCCGHLYCWSCFYKLPYAYWDFKECPVCYGEVSDSRVTPIYGGQANNDQNSKLKESGLIIPPRPGARRKKSPKPCLDDNDLDQENPRLSF